MHASACVYVHTRDSQPSIVIRYCSDTDTNTVIYIRYMVIKVMRCIHEGQWISTLEQILGPLVLGLKYLN